MLRVALGVAVAALLVFAAPAVAGAIAALASTGMGASAAADVLIHGANVPRRPGLGAILNPTVYA